MSETTGITWTDHTFNPWWGCVKISPACTHCYAERDAKRYGHDVWGGDAPRRFFTDKHWAEPFKWNKKAVETGVRRRVFCASMADVFERHQIEEVDLEMQAARRRLVNTILATPQLDWLLLTKRPEHIAPMWTDDYGALPNVWLGTTVETQEYADLRLPLLLQAPAVVHFASYEPALGPIDFRLEWLSPFKDTDASLHRTPRLDWVIAGGESGAGFRTANLEWYRSARDQCAAAGAAFFFKQYSGLHPKALGDRLDGVQHHEFPRRP